MIDMIIGGIPHNAMRVTAPSIKTESVEEFMDKMRHVASGIFLEKKRTATNLRGTPKNKDNACRNCEKKGHHHKK